MFQKVLSVSEMKIEFQKNLEVCRQTFDYTDEKENLKAKNERLEAILSIKTKLNCPNFVQNIIIPNLESIFEMVSLNLFRPLPKLKMVLDSYTGKPKFDYDPAWDHLKDIYALIFKIVNCKNIDQDELQIVFT